MDSNINTISLTELNLLVKAAIQGQFPELCWLRAEISELKVNASGHCYLEFIEKNPVSGKMQAKAQGKIWANTFRLLKPYFEKETGQSFSSGIKVLVQVAIDFHEIYGYSLTVYDIDPAYTIGDMMQHRAAVLKQLEEDGVLALNKELILSKLPLRIAVISSKTASGYEDFENQIKLHGSRFAFSVKLFPAIMQGAAAENAIIDALNTIYKQINHFDVVVIIRGGGAVSDLSCFDSYLLAANCAQFPLPIITGIGHEKDNSVLDIVAHTRVKTPTAAAEFLIDKIIDAENELLFVESQILQLVKHRLLTEKTLLSTFLSDMLLKVNRLYTKHQAHLDKSEQDLITGIKHFFSRENHRFELAEQKLKLLSPENILKKGYTLTLRDGKIIKEKELIQQGETITTRFFNGEIESVVK